MEGRFNFRGDWKEESLSASLGSVYVYFTCVFLLSISESVCLSVCRSLSLLFIVFVTSSFGPHLKSHIHRTSLTSPLTLCGYIFFFSPLSIFLSLSSSLSLSMSLSPSPSFYLSSSLFLCLCHSLTLPLSHHLSLSIFLSLSLPFIVCLSDTLALLCFCLP